jgi:heme-degrading monooxygenase HmoA
MIVRLTSFNVSPQQSEEVKKIYNQEVAPELKKQQGHVNYMLLEPNDSTEFISLTVWENKADADVYESSGKYKELVGKIKGLIGTPILKSYTTA